MSCGVPVLYLSTGWLAQLESYATKNVANAFDGLLRLCRRVPHDVNASDEIVEVCRDT